MSYHVGCCGVSGAHSGKSVRVGVDPGKALVNDSLVEDSVVNKVKLKRSEDIGRDRRIDPSSKDPGGERGRGDPMSTEFDDLDIVRKVLEGRKDLYRSLVEKYQSRAYSLAFDILKSAEDAEDVVQESFVKAFLSLKDFRGQANFYTWLYRIVYNMSIDVKRKLVRRKEVGEGFDDAKDSASASNPPVGSSKTEGPEEVMFRKEQSSQISRALSSLSEDHRMVVTLREIDGLSYDEIARVAGISKGTVMSRLHYARKKLQEALSGIFNPRASEDNSLENIQGEVSYERR